MELNWSTFLLEIINFLVLVWILKRFFYRPVLSVLEKRRKKIETSINQATAKQADALALEEKYQARLTDWEAEKQQAREQLQQEIQAERASLMQQLESEMESKKEKNAVVAERHVEETLRQYQQKSHEQGARFVSRLLNELASPELESGLFNLLIRSFSDMNMGTRQSLRDACNAKENNIGVSSAYTLPSSQCQQLEKILSEFCEQAVTVNYTVDPELIAGLRICVGAWVLRANLRDELSGFVELSHENIIR